MYTDQVSNISNTRKKEYVLGSYIVGRGYENEYRGQMSSLELRPYL
jgi:hypothetical protein